MFIRANNRSYDELREVKLTRNYTKYAEGSVLVEFGSTQVICSATIEESVPTFLKGSGRGWLTAEYGMLPRSTHTRMKRDAVIGKVNSRAQEISRLIGRSLRAALNLNLLGERQVLIDCDVIQADGGTRTASITGAFVALHDAVTKLLAAKVIASSPIKQFLAAVSVGVYQGTPLLDLEYIEDNGCDLDMNLVMLEDLSLVEIQGAAEGKAFGREVLNQLLDLGEDGITKLIALQKAALRII